MNLLHRIILCILFFLPVNGWASANAIDDQAQVIAEVEAYLNGLDSMQARFVQTAQGGVRTIGTFYLQRPGKLRFEYDAPIEDFVVADGVFIYFYDAELQQQTNAPIGQTMADFLLRKDIALSGDVKVQSLKRGGGYLQVELAQADDLAGGRLMLAFHEGPLSLRKWRVIDPQGLITEVELFNAQTGLDLDSSLFRYLDPNHGKDRPNLYNE